MRVSELLELEPVRRARPRWVVPASDREVTWVHSSEIYEIAPLLQGGEVLLTTGLGLVGADGGGFARYVSGLAARGVAALALELGRTFAEAPPELLTACRDHDLALVTFDAVVPFVQTCRAANEAILDHEAAGLRRQQRITATLTASLLDGQGLAGLLEGFAELTGTAVELVARDGHPVARAGTEEPIGVTGLHATVHLFGRAWGELRVDAGDRSRELPEVLERAVVAVELALLRTVDAQHQQGDAGRALLVDLARGSYADAAEVTARAAGVGLPTDRPVLPIALTADPGTTPAGLRRAASRVLERTSRGGIVGEVDDLVVGLLPAPHHPRTALAPLATAVAAELARTGGTLHRIVTDVAVARVTGLASGLRAAADGAHLADRLGDARRVLVPSDLAVLRLLHAAGDPAADVLVRTVLGAALAHDARHRPPLLPTLVAYLDAGRSKSRAAARLGVRRQTVHARLRRLAELLELDPDGDRDATTLHLAVTAWQARTAGGA